MNPTTYLFAGILSLLLGLSSYRASAHIITQGNEALVERLGRYNRKLAPGLHFIVPFFEEIAVVETTREQFLDIKPQSMMTRDNVTLIAGAVVYWRIIDLEKTYYQVQGLETALSNMVLTTLGETIGGLGLEETNAMRSNINQTLLEKLDKITGNWGIKVTRVEVRDLELPEDVRTSLEQERAAESKKRADLLAAEGIVGAITKISETLQQQPNPQMVLQFLIAQRYVEANEKLGKSPNSKVLFMDPNALNEAIRGLLETEQKPPF